MRTEPRWVWTFPMIKLIRTYFTPLRWSQWAMAIRHCLEIQLDLWESTSSHCTISFKKTRHKNITVNRGLKDNRWISNIWPIQEGTEIQELMTLREAINDVVRDVANEDQILWRWTTNGEYSTCSAYQAQFNGSMSRIKIEAIWKAKAEPKCRFFCVDAPA
jgi:hypothetical protein